MDELPSPIHVEPVVEPANQPVAEFAVEPAIAPVIERVSFTGDGREYFRIWIVNVMLSIVTLGCYSAWAKVRRLHYFYRNTRLAGSSFDYHGDPIAILKGRIVAAILFFLYSFIGYVSLWYALAIIAAIAAVMPWLLARSLRFRLHNSSYRGLRFRFSGSTRSAYWIFLGLPFLLLLSLWLAGPFWHQRLKRYQFGNSSYGQVPFTFKAPVQDFYWVYVTAAALGVVLAGAVGTVAVAMIALAAAISRDGAADSPVTDTAAIGVLAVIFIAYITGIVGLRAFVASRVRNLVWNHSSLGARRFRSTVRARQLAWLMLGNLVATIATLGLFWPFAQVRLARYLAESVSVEGDLAFGDFVSTTSPEEGAVGDEVSGFFDFDIAF